MSTRNETSAQPSRREKERLARRQLIVDAALEVFARRGFHAAKLEEVAERAEFGKATLYSYFDTKEALFEAVLADAFELLLARAEAAFAIDGTFEQKLAAYVGGEISYFFERPEGLHLMMSESSHLRSANPLIRLMPRYIAVLRAAIEKEQRARRIRRDLDAMELADVLRFMVFAQFYSRVHRIVEELGLVGDGYDEERIPDVMERIKSSDVEREIEHATTFITSVFLTGVAK